MVDLLLSAQSQIIVSAPPTIEMVGGRFLIKMSLAVFQSIAHPLMGGDGLKDGLFYNSQFSIIEHDFLFSIQFKLHRSNGIVRCAFHF